jgi:hypothetical protein
MWVGSWPVHRLPFFGAPLMAKIIAAQAWPETIVTAWSKLSDVKVSESSLSLTAQ